MVFSVYYKICELSYVSKFRYLGHVINDVLNDDGIKREIKNIFVTIVHNSRILIDQYCFVSCNMIVQWFLTIGVVCLNS